MRARWLAPLTLVLLAAPATARAAEGDIIVERAPGLDRAQRLDLRSRDGVRFAASLPLRDTELVDPSGSRAAALDALRADPDVMYAEPDRRVHAASNDPAYPDQWELENTGQSVDSYYAGFIYTTQVGTPDADIDAPEAWQTTRGAGVEVAVVDSGIDASHEDLAGRVDTALGYDWVDQDTDPDDLDGHGTHVAGAIAATADNGIGVAGVAPQARVVALRVLDENGEGYLSDVASAFAYAGAHGLRIVNASLGGPGSAVLESAIAQYPNTLYVVAAGNHQQYESDAPLYPCMYTEANVLCVGASDNRDQPAVFSDVSGTAVDLFAPGAGIWSTWPGDQYAELDGTSMATPQVAGAAALALAADPAASTLQLRAALLRTVDPSPALAGLSVTGGRLNAAAAVAAVSSMPPDPTPTPTPTPFPPAPPPAPPASPPAPPAPKLSAISVSGTLLSKKSKMRVRFSLTRDAKVLFAVTKRGSGTALAHWTQAGKAGVNTVTLTRKLPTKRTLKPGRYTLVLQLASTARSASFRVH